MKRSNVTIKEVAIAAGVSRATAARVLGDYGYSSGTVRDSVLKAAAGLGYAPSRIAKTMRNGRSQLIGFVSADITDGLFSEALGGICRVAEPAGYQVVVFDSVDRFDDEEDGINTLLSHGVDGLIVSPVLVSHYEHLADAVESVPLVCLDRVPAGFPGVVSDNEGAARRAASLLYAKGHRQIGLVASVQAEEPINLDVFSHGLRVSGAERPSTLRVRGFVEQMLEFGLALDKPQICLNPHRADDSFDLVMKWLDCHPELTALIAADSYQARHLYQALRQRGTTIPDEISVLVFSDDEWTGFVSPTIDTISLDGADMGARAATALLEKISGGTQIGGLETIAAVYHSGGSVGSIH